MKDLVVLSQQHNLANMEENRDGMVIISAKLGVWSATDDTQIPNNNAKSNNFVLWLLCY